MALPYFFQDTDLSVEQLQLDEGASRHIVQVLRMQEGTPLLLTDGKGTRARCRIALAHKKHCRVEVIDRATEPPRSANFFIGVAFTKSKSRNEWLLEKLTEIGTTAIFPLISQRSEREKFNFERYNSILISALIQSQQTFLPRLHEPVRLSAFLEEAMPDVPLRLLAHCVESERQSMLKVLQKDTDTLILIGPEGDFTAEEIGQCVSNRFIPVTLGPNRLRTETAGVYACTVFNANQYA